MNRHSSLANRALTGIFIFCLFFAVVFVAQRKLQYHLYDPDRYYHLALSREMANAGVFVFRELPNVVSICWDEFFPDKEFLFHQVTRLGHLIAGDKGVIAIVLALVSALGTLLFSYAYQKGHSILVSLGISLMIILWPPLFFRLLLLRPHVLAILLFTFFTIALLEKKAVQAFLFSCLFCLSYHAFYIPVLCLLCFVFVYGWKNDFSKKIVLASLYGISVGILVNPHFPGNLVYSWIHLQIPQLLQGELKNLKFGTELYTLETGAFLKYLSGPLLVFLGAVFFVGKNGKNSHRAELKQVNFLTILTLVILVLSMKSQRGVEYLLPVVGLLVVFLLKHLKLQSPWMRYSLASLIGISIVFFISEYSIASLPQKDLDDKQRDIVNSILQLPDVVPGKKVYNCSWDESPFLYYFRPSYSFVDILDPSLLYFTNGSAFQIHEALVAGNVADVYGMMRAAFRAEYVLCSDPKIVAQLKHDPGFRMLSPAMENTNGFNSYLFALREEPSPHPVLSFKVFQPQTVPHPDMVKVNEKEENEKDWTASRTTYVNFFKTFPEFTGGNAFNCSRVRLVIPEEISKTENQYLMLGGGMFLKLWKNGVPLFNTETPFLRAQNNQIIVSLDSPVKAEDKIELLSCSPRGASYWGVAASFWTKKELLEYCKNSNSSEEKANWKYFYDDQDICLGRIAQSHLR